MDCLSSNDLGHFLCLLPKHIVSSQMTKILEFQLQACSFSQTGNTLVVFIRYALTSSKVDP